MLRAKTLDNCFINISAVCFFMTGARYIQQLCFCLQDLHLLLKLPGARLAKLGMRKAPPAMANRAATGKAPPSKAPGKAPTSKPPALSKPPPSKAGAIVPSAIKASVATPPHATMPIVVRGKAVLPPPLVPKVRSKVPSHAVTAKAPSMVAAPPPLQDFDPRLVAPPPALPPSEAVVPAAEPAAAPAPTVAPMPE